MKKEILLGLLLAPQATPTFSKQPNTKQEIFYNLADKKENNKIYQASSKEIIEVLQNNIKKEIVNGTMIYFEKHTTANLTNEEKEKLKNDLNNFLKQYPNIISVSGNKVLLNINENNFRELFKILLPYFGRGDALKNYPGIIKNNDKLVLNHIRKSKGENANNYFYHFFGYLIMDIVNEINKVQNCDMTIGEYKNSMLKGLYIPKISDQNLPKNISDDSIKNLSKYF